MQTSASIGIETSNIGKSGGRASARAGKSSSADGFDKVLTSARAQRSVASAHKPDSDVPRAAASAGADGTTVPPAGSGLPPEGSGLPPEGSDSPAALDAVAEDVTAQQRLALVTTQHEPDPLGPALLAADPAATARPLPDGAAPAPLAAPSPAAGQGADLRLLQSLQQALANTPDGGRPAAHAPSAAADDGVAATTLAPAFGLAGIERPGTTDGAAAGIDTKGAADAKAADGAATLAALTNAAALDRLHVAAASADGGGNRQDGWQGGQSAPAVDGPAGAAARGTLAAMADSVFHGQPGDMAANLAHRVQWMTQHGLQLARIAVTPRELGPIDIQLARTDGALSMSITAQHPATRDLLEASADRLRQMFAADGVDLRLDVGGGQRGAGEQHPGWRPTDDARGTIQDDLPMAPPVRIHLSLLDAYA